MAAPGRNLASRGGAGGALPWIADMAIAGALASVLTALIYRLWDRPMRVPLAYTGDGLTQASVVKTIIETGWNTNNSRLGAPTGFVGHDFPLGGENLHYLAIKIISWFSSDPFLVLNLYFFGSFALCAASAVVAFRVLGLRRVVAHPMALLFAFVPAHLLRGPAQVTLASMFTVPLACIILVWAMGPLPLVLRHIDGHVRIARNGRLVALAAMVLLLGSGGAYYALFTVALLAIIGSLSALSRRSWMHLASAATVAVAIVVVLAANSLPSLLYQRSHGHNPMAMYRSASQLDALSLRPVQLVAPIPGHRVGFLSSLGREVADASPGGEGTQNLGVVGAVGFALIVLAVLSLGAGRRRDKPSIVDPRLGVIALVIVVCGATGGLAILPAVRGLDQLRAWGRLSVYVSFLSLLAVGQLIVHLSERLADRGPHKRSDPADRVALIAAAVLALVGLWDQVPNSIVADPRVNREAYFDDQAFVLSIEATLPAGSMVFQLPQASYPEEPMINGLMVDNLLRPYLHSRSLRWSFGGLRGTDVEWMEATSQEPMPVFLDSIAAIGFRGLVIDRLGYADNGEQIVNDLRSDLGVEPTSSGSGRHVFFDLQPRAQQVLTEFGHEGVAAIVRNELERPYLWWAGGFDFPIRRSDGDRVFRGRSSSSGTIVRPSDAPVSIDLTFRADSLVGPTILRVSAAGESVDVPIGNGANTATMSVRLDRARTPISWKLVQPAAGLDAQQLAIVISDVQVDVVG
ncbi:MAG: hypothetical protein AB7V43_04750 [Acidimicrobiia bacterium]